MTENYETSLENNNPFFLILSKDTRYEIYSHLNSSYNFKVLSCISKNFNKDVKIIKKEKFELKWENEIEKIIAYEYIYNKNEILSRKEEYFKEKKIKDFLLFFQQFLPPDINWEYELNKHLNSNKNLDASVLSTTKLEKTTLFVTKEPLNNRFFFKLKELNSKLDQYQINYLSLNSIRFGFFDLTSFFCSLSDNFEIPWDFYRYFGFHGRKDLIEEFGNRVGERESLWQEVTKNAFLNNHFDLGFWIIKEKIKYFQSGDWIPFFAEKNRIDIIQLFHKHYPKAIETSSQDWIIKIIQTFCRNFNLEAVDWFFKTFPFLKKNQIYPLKIVPLNPKKMEAIRYFEKEGKVNEEIPFYYFDLKRVFESEFIEGTRYLAELNDQKIISNLFLICIYSQSIEILDKILIKKHHYQFSERELFDCIKKNLFGSFRWLFKNKNTFPSKHNEIEFSRLIYFFKRKEMKEFCEKNGIELKYNTSFFFSSLYLKDLEMTKKLIKEFDCSKEIKNLKTTEYLYELARENCCDFVQFLIENNCNFDEEKLFVSILKRRKKCINIENESENTNDNNQINSVFNFIQWFYFDEVENKNKKFSPKSPLKLIEKLIKYDRNDLIEKIKNNSLFSSKIEFNENHCILAIKSKAFESLKTLLFVEKKCPFDLERIYKELNENKRRKESLRKIWRNYGLGEKNEIKEVLIEVGFDEKLVDKFLVKNKIN